MKKMQPPNHPHSGGLERTRARSSLLAHWFPAPQMLYPRSAGVDISDASVKWLVLGNPADREKIVSFGEEMLPEGAVVGGVVQDISALAAALGDIRKKLGVSYAHAALPEEAAYVFGMHVPESSDRKNVLSTIEFELEGRVPIPPAAAIYDYDVITKQDDEAGDEIGVSVFPRELAESYTAAFQRAGIHLLSLEVEARSIARAVSGDSEHDEDSATLIVDFGRTRTGFSVVKHGVPIFTSTVAVGGVTMTNALVKKLSMSSEDAEKFKNEEGLISVSSDNAKTASAEVLLGTASALADEVVRHFHYWDTRRNERGERVTPVSRVLLVGGSANLRGLSDYIATRVQAPAVQPNVWGRVCSFDEYIPPIDWKTSMQYATAIGLALRGV
jgi:type IV pilus assembly protein PilM